MIFYNHDQNCFEFGQTPAPPCEAIEWRKTLTEAIQRACSPSGSLIAFADCPADGSERSLAVSFSVLHGIVNEYLDGGDQIVENCTCGQHLDRP